MAALAARLVDAVVQAKPPSHALLRFVGVGGLATALQYLLLILLVELAQLTATAAAALSYAISSLFNYLANYHFTFASQAAHRRALPRFAAIAVCGLGLNAAIMFVLNALIGWHYLLAQLCATLLVVAWNFLANRRWTYAAPSEP